MVWIVLTVLVVAAITLMENSKQKVYVRVRNDRYER